MTRTYTVYFNEDLLASIRRELEKLELDAKARSRYIDTVDRTAIEERIEAVRLAINRLADIAG